MKTYQEVCTDLIMMLEDIEESLDDIANSALFENQPETNGIEFKSLMLKE